MTGLLLLSLQAVVHAAVSGVWEPVEGYKTRKMTVKAGTEEGRFVQQYDYVKVHATGRFKISNQIFWSTKEKGGRAFDNQAGAGSVIVGWDQGCLGWRSARHAS